MGKLSANLLVNKEIVAIKLNRNTILLEAFAKRLARKSTIIYSLEDDAR